MLVAFNALCIVGTIAQSEDPDPNADEGQKISKGIFLHVLSKKTIIFCKKKIMFNSKYVHLWKQ